MRLDGGQNDGAKVEITEQDTITDISGYFFSAGNKKEEENVVYVKPNSPPTAHQKPAKYRTNNFL